MSADEAAAVVKGFRQAMQYFLAPELREIRAGMPWLENVRGELREWRTAMDKRFVPTEHQLDTYQNVQTLRKQMAQLRAGDQPSAGQGKQAAYG